MIPEYSDIGLNDQFAGFALALEALADSPDDVERQADNIRQEFPWSIVSKFLSLEWLERLAHARPKLCQALPALMARLGLDAPPDWLLRCERSTIQQADDAVTEVPREGDEEEEGLSAGSVSDSRAPVATVIGCAASEGAEKCVTNLLECGEAEIDEILCRAVVKGDIQLIRTAVAVSKLCDENILCRLIMVALENRRSAIASFLLSKLPGASPVLEDLALFISEARLPSGRAWLLAAVDKLASQQPKGSDEDARAAAGVISRVHAFLSRPMCVGPCETPVVSRARDGYAYLVGGVGGEFLVDRDDRSMVIHAMWLRVKQFDLKVRFGGLAGLNAAFGWLSLQRGFGNRCQSLDTASEACQRAVMAASARDSAALLNELMDLARAISDLPLRKVASGALSLLAIAEKQLKRASNSSSILARFDRKEIPNVGRAREELRRAELPREGANGYSEAFDRVEDLSFALSSETMYECFWRARADGDFPNEIAVSPLGEGARRCLEALGDGYRRRGKALFKCLNGPLARFLDREFRESGRPLKLPTLDDVVALLSDDETRDSAIALLSTCATELGSLALALDCRVLCDALKAEAADVKLEHDEVTRLLGEFGLDDPVPGCMSAWPWPDGVEFPSVASLVEALIDHAKDVPSLGSACALQEHLDGLLGLKKLVLKILSAKKSAINSIENPHGAGRVFGSLNSTREFKDSEFAEHGHNRLETHVLSIRDHPADRAFGALIDHATCRAIDNALSPERKSHKGRPCSKILKLGSKLGPKELGSIGMCLTANGERVALESDFGCGVASIDVPVVPRLLRLSSSCGPEDVSSTLEVSDAGGGQPFAFASESALRLVRIGRVNPGVPVRRCGQLGGFSVHLSVDGDVREADAPIGEFLGPGPESQRGGQLVWRDVLGSADEAFGPAQDLVATMRSGGLPDFEMLGSFLGTQRMGSGPPSVDVAPSTACDLFFAVTSALEVDEHAFEVWSRASMDKSVSGDLSEYPLVEEALSKSGLGELGMCVGGAFAWIPARYAMQTGCTAAAADEAVAGAIARLQSGDT